MPGPVNASANAPVAYSSGTSIPFAEAKTPCFQCTLPAATTMTEITRAGPTGPRNPSAKRPPPTTSVSAAAAANVRPGRNPSRFHEPCRAVEPVTAKPAKQLLGTVANHQKSQNQAGYQEPEAANHFK